MEYRLRNLQMSSSVEGYLRNLLSDISDLLGLDDGLKLLLSERAWCVTDHCELAKLRAIILYDIEDAIEQGLPVVFIPEELAPVNISNVAITVQANIEQLGNPSRDRIEMSDISFFSYSCSSFALLVAGLTQ